MTKIPIVKICTQTHAWVHCIKLWYASQKEYQKRYTGLTTRLDNVQVRLDEVSQGITEKQAHREKIELFLDGLQKQKELVIEFDEDLWYSLIEYVTVFSKEDIRFTFKNGTEIKV